MTVDAPQLSSIGAAKLPVIIYSLSGFFFEADTPFLMVSMPFDEFMGDEALDIDKIEMISSGISESKA